MLGLERRERLGEDVRGHVLCRAVDQADLLVLEDPSDEMEPDVDVLRASVITVVLRERNGTLVVRVDCRRIKRC